MHEQIQSVFINKQS